MVFTTLVANATPNKPLPWNEVLTIKKSLSPVTYSWIGVVGNEVQIHMERGFPYNICEYTTVQLLIWRRVRTSKPWQFPATYTWMWVYHSCQVTIPAYEQSGYFYYILGDGEQVDIDNSIVPAYFDPCS